MVRSDLDGCGKFIKYSMFFVNFLIFIGGITVCGLGIWTLSGKMGIEKIMGDNYYVASAGILIAFGGLVAFISFLGCCGAIKEVKCLLALFFIIMFLLAVVIALGAIFAFVTKDKLADGLKEGLIESLKGYQEGKGEDNPITGAWDDVQKEFKCCGVTSPNDWSKNDEFQKEDPKFPASCCETDKCIRKITAIGHYKEGCYPSVEEYIVKHAKPMAVVGIIVAVIIVLAMVFSCALCLML